MTAQMFVPLLAALGAVPLGYGAALAARRLADAIEPRASVMIALAAGLAVWAAFVMPTGWLLWITFALGWALLVLATVDAIAFRLPDAITLPLIAVGIGVSDLLPDHDVIGHVAGMLAGLLAFYAIAQGYRYVRGREGLGLGDAKLAGAAGAWLGWQALPFLVLLACAVGIVWVLIAALRRGREALNERIPFGVALAFAIWAIWLYGLPDFLSY
ncbi:MAG: prepilin peptidase [Alphaproteobacteria bacterium]|nr:prepilin peptidase [Alphaproteobacteria bacterium]